MAFDMRAAKKNPKEAQYFNLLEFVLEAYSK
jgi:hypothetical protein